MSKFYAVRRGRSPGIYKTWAQCQAQVDNFSGARFKKFSSLQEAEDFVASGGRSCSAPYSSSSRCRPHDHPRPSSASLYTLPSSFPRPVVYADGCCYRNGTGNAQAGVGVYWGDQSPHNVSERLDGRQTNQRAELTAACRAIQSAISQNFTSVEVRTDSTYTIKAVTEWTPKWIRNGWKTVNGDDVKNRSDLENLQSLCSKIDVKWTHVPGHQGIAGNECADQLAKEGSSKQTIN